jgi:hypothetical protein
MTYNAAMPLQCNIDARGKRVRLINGIVLLLIGVLLILFWAIPFGGLVAWTICVALVLLGAFVIFESRSGWCAIRAMGFKTPI